MNFINTAITTYTEHHTTPHNILLQQLAQQTATHTKAHMISGHVQGRLLSMLSCIIKPLHVLEIGTFTGYSALCLAEGLQPNGSLHTIELREQDAAIAQQFFNNSTFANQLFLHIGNAKNIIPTLQHQWDLVFIDADKVAYIDYYNLVIHKLSNNGIIIVDNVLFHGEVVETPVKGKNALAIDAFNKYIAADDRVEQVMLTIRDGLTIIKKK